MNKGHQYVGKLIFDKVKTQKDNNFRQGIYNNKRQFCEFKNFQKQGEWDKNTQILSNHILNCQQICQKVPPFPNHTLQTKQKNNSYQKNNIYKIQQIMNKRNNSIVIGSYPYRGNTNICRMLCEYIGMPYQNQFFNPCSWKIYKQKSTQNWHFQELPFLKDGDLVITQIFAMCQYVIRKSGYLELLGKTPQDALIVDEFLWGKDLIQSILSLVVQHKNDPKRLMQQMHTTWIKTIRAQLLEYEKNAKDGSFYLGYLTVIDFIIHQIFQHYKSIFRKQMSSFPKLLAIREKVAHINKIKQFEKSDKNVLEICPLQFYRKWKMEMMKANNCSFQGSKNKAESNSS